MEKITEENLEEFLEYYHNLHDSWITNINYNIFDSKIEMLIDVALSGDGVLKEDNTYDVNKTKLRMVFNDVQQCDIKEMYSWDFIMNCYLKYIDFEDDEYICFANDEIDPMIYIVCEDIDYEEVKQTNLYQSFYFFMIEQ